MANKVPGAQVARYDGAKLTRHDFPPDFIFGCATSNYQVSIPVYTCTCKILDGSNGCFAIDHYNRFKEDVALLKKLGVDAYRFSLSWSRILPGGRLNGGINREGVKFYNDLIDLLLAEGIEPCVTIFFFDVPQCLEDEYGGFLSPKIVQDFAEYAEVCFFEFGDRVKFWITQNEPITFTKNGYVDGSFPPGHGSTSAQPSAKNAVGHRCARRVDNTCYGGDAGTEPYIVAHHLILAHADPYSDAPADIEAASRALDFMFGWFVAPIVTGDYPPVMRERVGNRLPKFTPNEVKLVKGSYDFLGINYYTTNWAAYKPTPPAVRDGVPIGEQAGSDWLYVVPYGIRNLLVHAKNKYNNPIIYLTENGVDEKNDRSATITTALKDDHRIKYHQEHLAFLKEAMDLGVRLMGYFPWSPFDNYEWTEGYTVRFGMYYVDYVNGYTRYPKRSAIWYMNFLNKNVLPCPKKQIKEIEDDNASAKRKRGY
ncbi:Oleuropein beta-glucosidase [Sesamum angolense]|uniref:Oleuropein beta-glucosidase n=1 Tax=Sesamum angolense TaxID=2727404 RepID=A0AAE1WP27_9LAMI|nr:Oleuropein beta-glucosidase [Sesamum angolense]